MSKKDPRNTPTKPKHKKLVDMIISGEAKTLTESARKVGYSDASIKNPKILMKIKGIQKYLATLDQLSQSKFNMSIQDKVMVTYFDALEATKLAGKEAVQHPDFPTRIVAADRFAKFFSWDKGTIEDDGKQYNQFNFFNVDEEKQKQFNANLKTIINKSYDK